MGRKFSLILITIFCFLLSFTYLARSQDDMKKSINVISPATLPANEEAAKSVLKTIAAATEKFTTINGYCPFSLDDLTEAKLPFLPRYYTRDVCGYEYFLESSTDSYKITATPLVCGKTGYKIFILEKGKKIFERGCE